MNPRQEERLFGSRAIADVFLERCRQADVEGFDAAHDDAHTNGSLAIAAACYAAPHAVSRPRIGGRRAADRLHWPWEGSWLKRTTRRRDLVKAAALLIAEIERLDRAGGEC